MKKSDPFSLYPRARKTPVRTKAFMLRAIQHLLSERAAGRDYSTFILSNLSNQSLEEVIMFIASFDVRSQSDLLH